MTDLASLPDRPLDRQELLALARALAADRPAWEPHVGFSDEQRHYVSLYRDAHVDVWVLCWTASNDTGWHDHDTSAGAVAVTQGELIEHNLTVGIPVARAAEVASSAGVASSAETSGEEQAGVRVAVPAGQAYSFGPDHIHRMTSAAAASVSIHVYSPPLWRMGQYAISSSGLLRRTSVSYADELRPL